MTTTKNFTIDVLKVKVTNLTTKEVAYLQPTTIVGFVKEKELAEFFQTEEEAKNAIQLYTGSKEEMVTKLCLPLTEDSGFILEEFEFSIIPDTKEVTEKFYKMWIGETTEEEFISSLVQV